MVWLLLAARHNLPLPKTLYLFQISDLRFVQSDISPALFEDGERWKSQLQAREDADWVGRMRSCSFKGLPLGSDSFVRKLEVKLGRRLRTAPVGRPCKKKPTRKKKRKAKRARNY